MAKFNTTGIKTQKYTKNLVENKAGGQGFKVPDMVEFAGIAFTSFVKDQYYRGENETITRLYELIEKVPVKFAAQVCWKTRHVYGLRSISHLIAARLASTGKLSGVSWAKKFFESIIVRPDDMIEILALLEGKPTHAMRKAFCNVMQGLNEYTLAKYAKFNNSGKDRINLNDIMRICHVPFTKGTNDPLEKLMYRTLKNTETWESLGNTKETWTKLLSEGKLGYLALIRNLRNIAKYDDKTLTDLTVNALENKESILNAKIFPFQFLNAYKMLKKEQVQHYNSKSFNKIITALTNACEIAVCNIPKLEGDTVILIDQSGSMDDIKDTAHLFACALAKASEDAIAIAFSYTNQQKFIPDITENNILNTALKMSNDWFNGGTDFISAFKFLQSNNIKCDRIIIITDEQHWVQHGNYRNCYKHYLDWTKSQNINPELWSIDLASYGTTQFPYEKVSVLYGFSEKIFDVINELEGDKHAFISSIDDVEFLTSKELKKKNMISFEVETSDEEIDPFEIN